jgi:hypothetical protein
MKFLKLALGLYLGSACGVAAAQSSTAQATASSPAASAKPAELTPQQEKMAAAMKKQIMKSYEKAELTADQEKKADEIFSKAVREVVVERTAAKITPELQRKQAAALKEAREAGKKPKEQGAEAFAKAGFTSQQIEVFKATQEKLNQAKRDFAKNLKEEQIQKLPEQAQKMLKRSK